MVDWVFARVAPMFAIVLLLCGTAAAAAEKNFGDIRFVTAGAAMTMLPTQVMTEKGFDKEEGFTAVLTRSAGAIGVKALVASDFDFGMSVGSALAAAVSGAPVKIVYVHVAKPLFFLYAREGIDSLKGLEGARVGIDAVGGSHDVAVRLAMQAAGADPSKVTFIAVGFQNIPGALIATAVDAGVISPPLEFQLAKSDKKFNYLGFLGDLVPSLSGGLAANEKMIRDRPDALRAVLRAHAKAHRFILEQRDQVIPIIVKFLNLTPDEAAKSYDSVVVHFTKTGAVPAKQQRDLVAEQARALKIANPPSTDAIFDFSFLGS